jgi:hypothetical protein
LELSRLKENILVRICFFVYSRSSILKLCQFQDLFRRLIDIKERVFLQENKVVTETQCDLGLTALRLNDVLDILADQYPDRYTELTDYLAKKRHIELANAQLANVSEEPQATAATSEPVKTGRFGRAILSEAERLKEMTKKAIKSAISYNQNLLKERKTERRSYFDLQTMVKAIFIIQIV